MSQMRNFDPNVIANRAKCNGWVSGEHAERDQQRQLERFTPEVRRRQDAVLNVYATWHWAKSPEPKQPFEVHKASVLCNGARPPELHELKDFWRFYKDSSTGRLSERPTAKSLCAHAKRFKAGFERVTGHLLSDEDTNEINRWLRIVLPQEPSSGVLDITQRKHNYKAEDLDRNLKALWSQAHRTTIHVRNMAQFHFLLLVFCDSGARRGGLLKTGVPYKDVDLIMTRRADGTPKFFFKLDQRTVKGNRDPENKAFGVTGREHALLRYNAVFLLLSLAIADRALDLDKFLRVLKGKGDGKIEWNAEAEAMPICRKVESSGKVHPTQPMTEAVFDNIFKQVLLGEYTHGRAEIHAIRREVLAQLNSKSPVSVAEHGLQSDPRVFGTSYLAFVSSCDGLAAFMQEDPDHSAPEYFQGLDQFWQPGLPRSLPAHIRKSIRMEPEFEALQRELDNASGQDRKRDAMQALHNWKRMREKSALKEYRAQCEEELREQRLLRGCPAPDTYNDCPMNEFIPQKGHVAHFMIQDLPPKNCDELVEVMHSLLYLLTTDWTVYYRQLEAPKDGACPYCEKSMESFRKQVRARHIHHCRRVYVAKKMNYPPSEIQFCFTCNDFMSVDQWEDDCRRHLERKLGVERARRCGSLTYQSTLVQPTYCPLCMQLEDLRPGERMRYWPDDTKARQHIAEVHGWQWLCGICDFFSENQDMGENHLHDAHGLRLAKRRRNAAAPFINDIGGMRLDDCLSDQFVDHLEWSPPTPEHRSYFPPIDPDLIPSDDAKYNSEYKLSDGIIASQGNAETSTEVALDELMDEFIVFPPTPDRTPQPDILDVKGIFTIGTSALSSSASAESSVRPNVGIGPCHTKCEHSNLCCRQAEARDTSPYERAAQLDSHSQPPQENNEQNAESHVSSRKPRIKWIRKREHIEQDCQSPRNTQDVVLDTIYVATSPASQAGRPENQPTGRSDCKRRRVKLKRR